MATRKRNKPIFFRVDEKEYEIIQKKMQMVSISDMGAYLRRMAIYGYMVELDMEPLNKLTVELSRIGNNLNQIAKRANETANLYLDDIEVLTTEIKSMKEDVRKFTNALLEDVK